MAPNGGQTTVGLTVAANMDVSGILNGVKSMQGAFNGLKLPANLTGDAIKQFDKLKESLTKYRELMEKGPSTKADLKQLEKLEKTIKSSFSDLSKIYDEFSNKKIYLEADATAIKNAQKDIDQLKQDVQNKLGSIKFEFSSPTKGKVDIGLNDLVSDMERAVKSSKTVSASMKEMTNSVKSGNFTNAAKDLVQIEQQATKLKGASVGLLKTFQQMGLIQFNKSAEDLYKSGQHVELLHQGFQKLRSVLSADDAELKKVVKSLEDATTKKSELEKIGETNYRNSLSAEKQNIDGLAQGYNQCADAARGFAQQTLSATQQVEQLQQSTQYFFSLRNMINLLKRGIDEAVQSVKDLDKAMTETAVVTDYKVSDLWGMLPEYTKVANDLGATTQGAYETMTLYYQQGLEQQQAFELGAETMKMARIAGLDYAETTDMMTAALRGFNMELNEVSAKRVNDVYSELAAITASDTEELGTAMQRTASIAASAGASFEGTTAFLAQAIETTREPAENIGTAMKTIVARFQELKKNPLEISEVEGEEVDYNKIDTALKTIGVDLKDANGQFRDFDQVMLDISARWDGLSQAQQRYIATTAAGSRQQSRFIAMVSNYDRTMQLMEAANNSAGASDEQFGKTMDSLESKLNKLHNAWQQFTMGIANNGMIKLAVDGLTGFLNVTNKVIDTLSLGSGVFKSFLSVFAAFTGLKASGRIANRLIGGLGGLVDPTSTFKQGFKGGAIKQGQTGAAQAKAISDPIVTAVNRIYGAITGKQVIANQTAQNTSADFKTFKNANTEMRNFLSNIKANEKFSIAETYGKISHLDTRQQKAVLQQLPGLQLSLQKGLNFNTADLSDDASKLINTFKNEINQGLKDKAIDSQGVLQLFGTPDNFKKGMAARGPEYVKAAEEILNKGIDKAKIQDEALNSKIAERDLLGAKWSDDQILEMAQKEADRKIKTLQENNLKESIKGTASAGMEAADDIASIGQAAVMAGQGVAQLGMQLSNAGFEQAGQAITNLGYQISSLGQIATSVGSTIGKISDAGGIGALVAAHPAITAVVAAVALLGGAFAIASAHFKEIKEAGEEVTNTFKETSKSTEDNIAKLKSYQSELATLSKGIDSNGNNVSLDDSQYQRYLEIVDDIATINPEIVEGYNAQGHAIINNNTALAETLQKQEEIKKSVLDTYTKEESLQKLINARNINKDYKNIRTQENGVSMGYGHGNEGRNISNGIGNAVPLAGDVSSIADKLRLVTGTDALGNTIKVDDGMLQKYGIESLDALISGEEQAVKKFIKHRDQIQADLTNSGIELNEGIIKGFEKLGEDSAAFDAAIQPVYDNLLANVSNSKAFESIAPEFREALNMGLKDLASQDLSASDMSRAATTMATKFANLTTGSGKYQEAMDKVADAQEKFAASLEETEYKANVQPAIDDLVRLKEEALKEGDAYGNALAEYLENQIEQIANFTEQGTTTIQEGLNTATDAIAQAESALDNFNEATKKDFSTAAEGMRSIYDKIFETYKDSYGNELEKHTEGEGDNTFWTGAEALLSEDKLAGGVKEVTKSLKELEPWLREGKEGMDAFFTDVINNKNLKKLEKDGLISLDKNGWFKEIPEDQWNAVADALGISEDLLTSMLNKARQFGLIEFDNLEKVREALATSDSAITGVEANAQGQKALYVKEDTMRQNLREAGYNTKESQDKVLDRLFNEQNVHIVKTMENLSKQDATDLVDAWGIKDLPDLITKMSETGEYNREEILDLAEKAGLGSGEAAADIYDKVISALDNPELAAQTSELQSINAKLDAIVDKETGKSVEDHEAAQQEAHEAALGKNGIATNFAKGLDAEGKVLDTGSFAVVRDELEKTQAQYEESAAYYRERAEIADDADKKRFNDLANLYEADAAAIQKAITQGEKAKKKLKDDAEDRKGKDKLKRDDSKYSTQPDVNQSRDEGRKQHREVVEDVQTNKEETTTFKAKTDSSFTKVQKEAQKLTGLTEEEYTLKLDVAAEQLDEAREDIYLVQSTVDENLLLVCDADTSEIIATQQKIVDTQNQANKGVNLVSKGNTAGIDKVKGALSTVAGKTFSAALSVSTGGALGALQKIWDLIVKIKNNNPGGGSKGTPNAKHRTTGPQMATGARNHGVAAVPIVGSAARGGYGRLGPKGKGGPTLTGELGYEVAWLPSENRSMILGANGPQMIDLPGNAVVWNHEQSKKILKQKAIPVGSQANPYATGDSSGFTVTYNNDNKAIIDANKHLDKAGKKITDASKKVTDTSKKAYGWWAKMERHVKNLETATERLRKKIDKMVSDLRMTVDDFTKVNSKYEKMLKDQISSNKKMVKKANSKLEKLDTNKATVTAKVKNSKGKTVNKKFKVGKYIKKDKVTGEYEIDRKAWNKVYNKKGKGKEGKALLEALESTLDKWTDRKNTAQNNVDEASDALQEFRKEQDDLFYGWENELTKIYTLTKDIEITEAKIANEQKKAALAQSKISDFNYILGNLGDVTGRTANQPAGSLMAEFNNFLKANKEQLRQTEILKSQNQQLAQEYAKQYQELTHMSSQEQSGFNSGLKMDSSTFSFLSERDKKAFAKGILLQGGNGRSAYFQNGQFDTEAFERDRQSGKITEELYNEIKDAYDKIKEAELNQIQTEGAILDAETDLYEIDQERIKLARELYENLYGWKNELNRIYILSKQIANSQDRSSRFQAQFNLMESKLKSGMSEFSEGFGEDMLKFFKGNLDASGDAIAQSWESIQEQTKKLSQDWSAEKEQQEYETVSNQYNEAAEARHYKEMYDAASAAMSAVRAANASTVAQSGIIASETEELNDALDAIAKEDKTIATQNSKIKKANNAIKKDNKTIKSSTASKKSKTAAKKDKAKQEKKVNKAEAKKEAAQDRKDVQVGIANESAATIEKAAGIISSNQAIVAANRDLASQLNYYADKHAETESAWIDDAGFNILEARRTVAEEEVAIRDLAHQFLSATQMGDGSFKFEFDSEGFEALRGTQITTEMANRVTEYVNDLIETNSQLNTSYADITNKLQELYDGLRELQETMAENAESLLTAYNDLRSKEINRIKTLTDSINNSIKDLLDQVKKALDERRRQEDNAKTETNISQQQNRLTAMRMNTASGNQVTLAQLQKELSDSQQAYGRSLEDQLIQKLQDGADAAYKQRQKQINLLSGILEADKISGRAAAYIESLIDNQEWDVIKELKTTAAETSTMTRWQQDIFGADLNAFLSNIALFEEKRWTTELELEEAKRIEEELAAAQAKAIEEQKRAENFKMQKIATYVPNDNPTYNAVPVATGPSTVTLYLNTSENNKVTVTTDKAEEAADFVRYVNARDAAGKVGVTGITKMLEKGNAAGLSDYQVLVKGAKTDGLTYKEEFTALKKAGFTESDIKDIWDAAGKTMSKTAKNALNAVFLQGGLADFTGPAWLDGTPSKPELVLNAADTKNFIALKDVLSRVMKLQNSGDGSFSNANFEINVNVDHISNDYDVDKLTERIKRNIVKDASYRNVTQARRMR